jgi:hypothetical protein
MAKTQRTPPPYEPPEGCLTPLELYAVGVAIKQETKHHEDLRPGAYDVDVSLHVHGNLAIAHPAEYAKTVRPSEVEIIAWLLAKFGAAKRMQLANTGLADFLGEDVPMEVTDQAERLIENLKTKEPATRKGAVTGVFTVERAVGSRQ